MGNGLTSLDKCFAGEASRRYDVAVICSDKSTIDEGFGHSFCYIRPEYQYSLPSSKVCSEEPYQTTTFRSISGASVSANTFTPLSTSLVDLYSYSGFCDKASAFESSISFASVPLQPVPKNSNPNYYYNTLSPGKIRGFPGSGPIEKGFLSGPIERGFASGPIERGLYSGPMDKILSDHNQNQNQSQMVELQKSTSHRNERKGVKSDETSKCKKKKFFRFVKKVMNKTLSKGRKSTDVEQVLESDCVGGLGRNCGNIAGSSSNYLSGCVSLNEEEEEDGVESRKSQNLQWAEGKAGEDRVHIVISEKNGWVFVGIYDGFNGPDAPDYLLSNLYVAVHKELEGLLWNAKFESELHSGKAQDQSQLISNSTKMSNLNFDSKNNQNKTMKNQQSGSNRVPSVDHSDVLKALSRALMKTEEAYLEAADKMVQENPELALMGSCVLVMLMKGEDVYIMNVGDSRAVLAQQPKTEVEQGQTGQVDRDEEEEAFDGYESDQTPVLTSLQLSMDHSTNIEEEAERIRREHPDDALAISKDRVKGSLKVTRAFGAGFLKQPKWNNALLETFRIDFVGNSPYISCSPSLYHHRLGPRDNFLILSSDGLYQYFTNQEAVSQVELFMDTFPEGDPAQHLIEEVLFRAAKKAGMDFHDLLDIPQGDRRRYHDDVSIIIISLEGRIWRSSV